MAGKRTRNGRERDDAFDDCRTCSVCCEQSDEQEHRIRMAVESSMRRFLRHNEHNIRTSGKDRVASASYCGGMVDMIAVIKAILGSWAVDQLLSELERWDEEEDDEDEFGDEVPVPSLSGEADAGRIDARELAAQIVKWMEDRRRSCSKVNSDPMFA